MARTNNRRPELSDNEFYEVMPYAAPAQRYRDDTDDWRGDEPNDQSVGRATAIITLIAMAAVVLALSFLVVRGLDALRTTQTPATSSTGF